MGGEKKKIPGFPGFPGLGSSPKGPVAQKMAQRAGAGQTSALYSMGSRLLPFFGRRYTLEVCQLGGVGLSTKQLRNVMDPALDRLGTHGQDVVVARTLGYADCGMVFQVLLLSAIHSTLKWGTRFVRASGPEAAWRAEDPQASGAAEASREPPHVVGCMEEEASAGSCSSLMRTWQPQEADDHQCCAEHLTFRAPAYAMAAGGAKAKATAVYTNSGKDLLTVWAAEQPEGRRGWEGAASGPVGLCCLPATRHTPPAAHSPPPPSHTDWGL